MVAGNGAAGPQATGAVQPGPHMNSADHKLTLKHSPTLLFDILAEPDLDKQQEKLRSAAAAQLGKRSDAPESTAGSEGRPSDARVSARSRASGGPSSSATGPGPGRSGSPFVPPPRTPSPPTDHSAPFSDAHFSDRAPHLPPIGPAAHHQSPAPRGTSAAPASGEAAPPHHAEAPEPSAAATTSGTTSDPATARPQPGAHHPSPSPHPASRASAAAASSPSPVPHHALRPAAAHATTTPAMAASDAAAQHGGAAAALSAATGLVTSSKVAEAEPPQAQAVDPLLEFTPRLILEELLGELFLAPERLKLQGDFGQGAFATVQRCNLESVGGGLGRLVAVKALKPHVLSDADDLKAFLLEANLLRKMHHPNIVSVVGIGARELGTLDGLRRSAYVVMEALEGGDLKMMVLKQMTSHSPAYSRRDALRWCMHIASACAYLHLVCKPMIIHRDLKLENVMLTGGAVDSRVAKITDFGLHKRAMHSRTQADVLLAVTNEWSTRAGSIYRQGQAVGQQYSKYEASYYGGTAFYGASALGGSVHRAASGGQGSDEGSRHAAGSSMHRAAAAAAALDRSTSAHYAALASAGIAAAMLQQQESAASSGGGVSGPASTSAAAVRQGSAPATGGLKHSSSGTHLPGLVKNAFGSNTQLHGSTNALYAMADPSQHGGSMPGDSMRAGSEAAYALGAEKPYLLAMDAGRYASVPEGSLSSMSDAHGAQSTHLSGAQGHSAHSAHGNGHSAHSWSQQQQQHAQASPFADASVQGGGAAGEMGPSPQGDRAVLPSLPGAIEESVHRKMLAIMALEAASQHHANGGEGFSVTHFVRAATQHADNLPALEPTIEDDSVQGQAAASAVGAARAQQHGAAALTPLQVLRSMGHALQQQQQQQQQGGRQPSLSGGGEDAAGALPSPLAATSQRRPGAGPAFAMKTVPEDKRMSIDIRPSAAAPQEDPQQQQRRDSHHGSDATSGSRSESGGATAAARRAPPPPARSVSERGRVANAAARMAGATRQVGSLMYMAPEIATGNAYNEKVDVFSFGVMAYELFMGKLLAMKVAAECAALDSNAGGGYGMPGGGGADVDKAEALVMQYVMRRSEQGVREPLPAWWPQPLRDLITACWAGDPNKRPAFDQVVKALNELLHSGAVDDMDKSDPLRQSGCCTIM